MRHCVGIDVDEYGEDLVESGLVSILVLILAVGHRVCEVALAVDEK